MFLHLIQFILHICWLNFSNITLNLKCKYLRYALNKTNNRNTSFTLGFVLVISWLYSQNLWGFFSQIYNIKLRNSFLIFLEYEIKLDNRNNWSHDGEICYNSKWDRKIYISIYLKKKSNKKKAWREQEEIPKYKQENKLNSWIFTIAHRNYM